MPRSYCTESFRSSCYLIDAFHPIHPALDMTVTKAELIRTIVDTVGLTQREAKEMVDAFFSEITAYLIRGEEIKLAGFGVLETRDKGWSVLDAILPQAVVMVTPRRVVAFRPSTRPPFSRRIKSLPSAFESASGSFVESTSNDVKYLTVGQRDVFVVAANSRTVPYWVLLSARPQRTSNKQPASYDGREKPGHPGWMNRAWF